MRVIILPGCRNIGNGAIVGAGSILTHDVEPYSIVAGNPAKVLRKRFSELEIDKLENSHWFEYEPEELRNAIPFRNNIDLFIKHIIEVEKGKNDECAIREFSADRKKNR